MKRFNPGQGKRSLTVFFLLVSTFICLNALTAARTPTPSTIPLSDFLLKVSNGQVALIKEREDNPIIEAVLRNGQQVQTRRELTVPVTEYLNHLEIPSEQRPTVEVVDPSVSLINLVNILLNLSPILIVIGAFWFFRSMRPDMMGDRARGFGRSKARSVDDDRPKTRFSDVAGVEEQKQDLAEVVEFLKEPQKFHEVGARIPKGVLLIGPPGTGKTLLARAVAGEAGVPFFSIAGSEFVEMFVGVGASRVRDLFARAKKETPAIIFIDEIDAVGRHRGSGIAGSRDEHDQTLNQVLVEMDGFEPDTGVIIIAATNRPDVLDPALLRAGRFDRQVTLDPPDVVGRREILRIHARGKPIADAALLDKLARETAGFAGADLENLLNEAAILTARHNKKLIGAEELEDAFERVVAGPERKSRIMSPREKQLTAYHEAGHAIVAHVLPNVDPVDKVSIVARGIMGGYTRVLPVEDRRLGTFSQFRDTLAFMMGGAAAEDIIYRETSTGASNDLERATDLARRMVTQYGMSDRIGPMALATHADAFGGFVRDYSEHLAENVDREVGDLLAQARQRARTILDANRETLEELVRKLFEGETLSGELLQTVLATAVLPEAADLRNPVDPISPSTP